MYTVMDVRSNSDFDGASYNLDQSDVAMFLRAASAYRDYIGLTHQCQRGKGISNTAIAFGIEALSLQNHLLLNESGSH
jgi:hypothetical protein